MSGALIIGTDDNCQLANTSAAKAHTYVALVLELPDEHRTVTVRGVNFDTSCGVSESQLGWRRYFSIQGV